MVYHPGIGLALCYLALKDTEKIHLLASMVLMSSLLIKKDCSSLRPDKLGEDIKTAGTVYGVRSLTRLCEVLLLSLIPLRELWIS